jgi:amidase
MKATVLPAPGASREETVARAFEMTANTMPTDVAAAPRE